MKTASSIFTKIISGDIPGYIPYQDDTVAVVVALEGHLLVVPKTAYQDIHDIPEEIAAHIMTVAVRVAKVLPAITACTGINLIQSNGSDAGQEVPHFHLHIKPRFPEDGTCIDWDTSTQSAEVREALAKALTAAL
jgi:histidine triad (HIT) family protein